MTPNPKSIDEATTVRETAEVLQKHGIHIAPVIDAAGRPVGAVSRTDLLDYWGRRRDRLAAMAAGELCAATTNSSAGVPGDELSVREIMTPVVFGVRTSAPIPSVVEKMLALEVRSLFVTDEHGVLVGTISVFDLLRHVVRRAAKSAGTESAKCQRSTNSTAARRDLVSAVPP
jgi:CBS domain-containing protein